MIDPENMIQENKPYVINMEKLRKKYNDLDRAFNILGKPSLSYDILEIFRQGLMIDNKKYLIKAVPFRSVFLLKIYWRKQKTKPFEELITYSISEIIDKAWMENLILSNKTKEALNFIHEELVDQEFTKVLKSEQEKKHKEFLKKYVIKKKKKRIIKQDIVFRCPETKRYVTKEDCLGCPSFSMFIQKGDTTYVKCVKLVSIR